VVVLYGCGGFGGLDWMWRAFELFSRMVPGEMGLFHESELEQAETWLAG
jgi:hypothetical protein